MIKLLLIIIALLLLQPNLGLGQENVDSVKIICFEKKRLNFYVNGYRFSPKDTCTIKILTEKQLCQAYILIYHLEGLRLTEKEFKGIGVKNKDTIGRQYAIHCMQNKKANCINKISLFVQVSIPIILNGIKIENNKYKKVFSKLSTEDILSIKRKSVLFHQPGIYVKTKKTHN